MFLCSRFIKEGDCERQDTETKVGIIKTKYEFRSILSRLPPCM